jgi:hypothetical protein
MNKIEWIGLIGLLIVVIIMSGCAGYDITWQRGEMDPVVVATT